MWLYYGPSCLSFVLYTMIIITDGVDETDSVETDDAAATPDESKRKFEGSGMW